MKTIYSIFLLLILMAACVENKNPEKNDKIHQPSSPVKTLYELYEPQDIKLPNVLFIVIDAQANTDLALERFHYASDVYGFRVLALKNVKNNTPNFLPEIQQAIKQGKENLSLNSPNIYLVGFSGGARMALKYANANDVKGVMMIGAGPQEHNISFPFSIAMITGTKDFNFIEQYYPITSPQIHNPNLLSLHWPGKHEWPDSSLVEEASSFILYASIAISENEINQEHHISKAKNAQEKQDLFLYFKQLELISKTSTGTLKEKVESSIKSIQKSPKAQSYFSKLNTILVEEQTRKQEYIKNIDMMPLDWWKNTISDLNYKIELNKPLVSDSYSRSKSFLGLLLFSKISQALNGSANAKLTPKYLSVYELIEPNNPDLFFFKAQLSYNLGKNEEAIKNLKDAVNHGFDDIQKMQQSFPAMIVNAAQEH